MILFRFAFLLVGLLFLVPGSRAEPPAHSEAPRSGNVTSVPMEILRSKHIAVKIKVNGKGPYRVIFDTGSPVTLLSNKVAQDAGLLSKDQAKSPALFGARGQGVAKTLEVGDIKVEDMPVMVMDHPALKAAAKVLGPLDGIVGFPFFSRYRATFDYQAQKITFEPVSYKGTGMDIMQMMMVMMSEKNPKPPQKVQNLKTLWGMTVTKEESDTAPGVDVKEVLPQSPAAVAGLKPQDRLLEFDVIWTESVEDCFRAAATVAPGQAVRLKIKRDGRDLELRIAPRLGI